MVLLLVSTVSAAGKERPLLFGELEPGPHPVGFRLIDSRAAERLPSDQPRALELALWYPARPGGDAITFGEYFQLSPDLRQRSAAAGEDAEDLARTLSTAISGAPDAVDGEVVGKALDAPMLAVRDAEPRPARHPVVLWTARYGTTAAQAVMSEYLASHGYVVAFARPVEGSWKLPFELKSEEEKADELEAQVLDLRGAMRTLLELPEADPARRALIAWSYAGEAASRLQRSDAEIDLVIGLSTNLLSNWVYQTPEAEKALIHIPPRVPYVLLTEKEGRPEIWPSLPAGSKFERFENLRHGNFNFVEGMLPAILGVESVQKWSSSGAEAKRGYENVSRSVLSALSTAFPTASRAAAFTPAEVRFRSGDRLEVTADFYRATASGGPCVLLFHQSGSSRGEYRTIAPELAARGFSALAVDLRSGRRDRWNLVWNETARKAGTIDALERGDGEKLQQIMAGTPKDEEAALKWLRDQRGCGRVVVWGSSFSANHALEMARRFPDQIGGVIAFSPGEYDPANPEAMRAVAAEVKVPSWVVWGRREDEISEPVSKARRFGTRGARVSRTGFHGSSILFDDTFPWGDLWVFLERVALR
jgi:dienelactone hydrolase